MDWSLADGGALLIHIVMGLSLAACAGLRAFVPLLIVGAAGRLDLIPLTQAFDWMASTPALVVFGVAVVAELAGDKFPVVDNFLDLLQGFVKPIAGTLLVAAVVHELTPLQATALGLIAGGSTAGAVHFAKAKTRLLSSVTTAGFGNPVLSVVEDLLTFAGSILSILMPVLAFLLLLVGIAVVWSVLRRFRREATRPAAS